MSAKQIPLANVDRQSLTCTLGDSLHKVTVWQQPSDKGWYISIEKPPGTALAQGRRITLGEAFSGGFKCVSLSAAASEPGDDPWGATHALIYDP